MSKIGGLQSDPLWVDDSAGHSIDEGPLKEPGVPPVTVILVVWNPQKELDEPKVGGWIQTGDGVP